MVRRWRGFMRTGRLSNGAIQTKRFTWSWREMTRLSTAFRPVFRSAWKSSSRLNAAGLRAVLLGRSVGLHALRVFGLHPQHLHFVERCLFDRAALFLQSGFYGFEPAHEFCVGAAQRSLRIE